MKAIIGGMLCASLALGGCAKSEAPKAPAKPKITSNANEHTGPVSPIWRNATVYFLMTDRFLNADNLNDGAYDRQKDGDMLRSFEGGDIAGIIQKLEDGYFKDLGVTAIWTTPVIEQIHQPFEEYGRSYGFHGYWPRDWTTIDKAYGTEDEFARMVELAHEQGIRIVVDVILNHSGPAINALDPAWPESWVRTEPRCDYATFATTATCLIVPALQDIRTESDTPVDLPKFLVEKWKAEGRYDQEMAELDDFFDRTGYPRAPRYYLIKWNTDWVREYGVDAFRIDTAKHVAPGAWAELKQEAGIAFAHWKIENPGSVLDDTDFYMFGEVMNWGLDGFERAVKGTREFDFGDTKVDFFDYGFDGLINMGFATHAKLPMPELFQLYSDELNGTLAGQSVLNYIASHDDMNPFDPERLNPFDAATRLVLAPGSVQVFYGDELARDLTIEGAAGDATLRLPMNWEALETPEGKALLLHWQKLSTFRKRHPSIGAGTHNELGRSPFMFSRDFHEGSIKDSVLIGIAEDSEGLNRWPTHGVFKSAKDVTNAYSGEVCKVQADTILCETKTRLGLFEQ